jgi:hypothetical protein
MIGHSHEVSNFNRLFFKFNRFITNRRFSPLQRESERVFVKDLFLTLRRNKSRELSYKKGGGVPVAQQKISELLITYLSGMRLGPTRGLG